jgi:DNA-directed RNA polymerase specialized sigma24 family protein
MFKKYTKINRPLKSIEDIDLLKSLKSENKEDLKLAQEEFFYRYRNYIYVVSLDRAKHFNKGAEMAEDMAQETLIKAFRNIHNLKLKEDTSKANKK